MTLPKWDNNWSTTLTAAALTADTALTVDSVEAAKLGTISPTDFYVFSLDDGANIEIVRCTDVTGGTLTVTRAQEGGAARDWAVGTPHRVPGDGGRAGILCGRRSSGLKEARDEGLGMEG